MHIGGECLGVLTGYLLDISLHNRRPETAHVGNDLSGNIASVGHVRSDLVCHLDQMQLLVIQCGIHRHTGTLEDGRTSTAVTLYSGQLVAQSELSVVITLVPLTGWWKVV